MILMLGILLGVALALAGFRALILVPLMALFGFVALAAWDLGPVVAAVGAQAGYMLGSWLLTTR